MTQPDPEDGTSRDDLLQRIELMEAMIAEGRMTTMRCGWIFALWGLVNLIGMVWQMRPVHSDWVWPICLGTGLVLTVIGLALRKPRGPRCKGMQSRSVVAVWAMMGAAMIVYVGAALATHFTWQYSYLSALLIIIGLAHAISAMILRWRVQAVVAGIWWAGAVAVFVFNSRRAARDIFLVEMCFGMIAFGIYVMLLEYRGHNGLKGERA
jgi:hypothetical protein